jgi:hypothetical protein
LTANSSAAVTCGGISAQRSNNYDQVLVDFGFRVDDRFIMLQAVDNGELVEIYRYLWVEQISGNTVTVHNQRLDCNGPGFCGGGQMRFFIFVF